MLQEVNADPNAMGVRRTPLGPLWRCCICFLLFYIFVLLRPGRALLGILIGCRTHTAGAGSASWAAHLHVQPKSCAKACFKTLTLLPAGPTAYSLQKYLGDDRFQLALQVGLGLSMRTAGEEERGEEASSSRAAADAGAGTAQQPKPSSRGGVAPEPMQVGGPLLPGEQGYLV